MGLKKKTFPFLYQMFEKGYFSEIDLFFSVKMTREFALEDEDIAVFFSFLSLAAQEGHLCVKVDREIIPSVSSFFQEEEDRLEVTFLEEKKLEEMIKKAAFKIGPLLDENATYPIVKKGYTYYLRRIWEKEVNLAKLFLSLLKSKPYISFDDDILFQKIEKSLKSLLPEQKEAIYHAFREGFSIITGGPGTGKTFTAAKLISLYFDLLSDEEKKSCRILITAPTGKAVGQLKSSLHKVFDNKEIWKKLQAKTLHSALQLNPFSYRQESLEDIQGADLILVDEASMLDLRMFEALFSAVCSGTRLILMGDIKQLPPIESGSLFVDFVYFLKNDPKGKKHLSQLHKCLRAEGVQLIDFAHCIHQGNWDEGKLLIDEKQIFYEEIAYEKKARLLLLEKYFSFLTLCKSAEQQLEIFNKVRILSPLRKGFYGVDQINSLSLIKWLKLQEKKSFWTIPIIITKNDRSTGLSNGDIGVLVVPANKTKIEEKIDFDQKSYALFRFPGDESMRKIPLAILPSYEYAFCLSVHKSQGSEFDYVFFLAPKGIDRFGRELFYTAVTRAKKKMYIFGDKQAIQLALKQRKRRFSGILNTIKENKS